MTDVLDISPRTHLLASMRDGGPVDYVLLAGEGIDNALDAGASRISLTITPDEIRFKDDGRGITRALLPSIFTLGDHGPMPTSRLGRFGVGIKIQALRAGNGFEVRTACADGATIAKIDWPTLLRSRRWEIPAPRWLPVSVGAPTGTEIVISDLREAPGTADEAIRFQIALRFHPALIAGAEIVCNGHRIEALAEPALDDVIECHLRISDDTHAHVRAGLLTADSPLKLVHVGFEHRVLMPGVRLGCGSYSGLSKLFARVQLFGRWHLGQFKDQLPDEQQRRQLEDALEDALRPLLEKCQAGSMSARLDKLTAELNERLPEHVSARPKRTKRTPVVAVKRERKPAGYVAPGKSEISATGPARTERQAPARLLIEFDNGAEQHGVGTFDGSGRPHRVILSKDEPFVARLIEQRDRHSVALEALYGFAIAIYVAGVEMQRAAGREREFPELEGTFGQQISRLLASQDIKSAAEAGAA